MKKTILMTAIAALIGTTAMAGGDGPRGLSINAALAGAAASTGDTYAITAPSVSYKCEHSFLFFTYAGAPCKRGEEAEGFTAAGRPDLALEHLLRNNERMRATARAAGVIE